MTTMSQASSDSKERRVDVLARPKPVPAGFEEDRRSVYWIDYQPRKGGPGGTTIDVTPRVQELSRPKTTPNQYMGDRPTPIWQVSSSAQRASASERVETLSKPKYLVPLFLPDRSPYANVTSGAKQAKSSARIDMLAVPHQKSDLANIRDINSAEYNKISENALNAKSSARVDQLAEAKKVHPLFQEEKPVQWVVSDSATKSLATLRLQQLSRPRSRSLAKDDYDPYKVTLAARRAHITPRVEELAVPFPRKVRKKLLV